MRISVSRRAVFAVGIVAVLFIAWLLAGTNYRCVTFMFRIAGLHAIADGTNVIHYAIVGNMAVWLIILCALNKYKHLSDKGLHVGYVSACLITVALTCIQVGYSKKIAKDFEKYKLVIEQAPANTDMDSDLGDLQFASYRWGDELQVYPFEQARILRAYDRLLGKGYVLRYKNPEYARSLRRFMDDIQRNRRQALHND